MNKTDLAWAAGFIDGEGCISLVARKNGDKHPYYQPNLNVPQIDKKPLNKLQQMFGGRVRANKVIGNRRPSYVWVIHARGAREALKAILPYLIVKKYEANLLLTIEFSYPGVKLSENEKEKREKVSLALKDHHKNYIFEDDL